MDQETAQKLFYNAAIMVFLDAPKQLHFGIDYKSWQIGPKFKGVKFIPPGLHFIYYGYVYNNIIICTFFLILKMKTFTYIYFSKSKL